MKPLDAWRAKLIGALEQDPKLEYAIRIRGDLDPVIVLVAIRDRCTLAMELPQGRKLDPLAMMRSIDMACAAVVT